jgi:ElaB/YqjD/DUF883 family membrane-anchored ribosome-binding protein
MSKTIVEIAGDHVAQSIHDASRVTSEVADAVAEGVNEAKCAAKQSCKTAEDFVHDSTRRIQRNPLAVVAATLVAGFALGILAGRRLMRRR